MKWDKEGNLIIEDDYADNIFTPDKLSVVDTAEQFAKIEEVYDELRRGTPKTPKESG